MNAFPVTELCARIKNAFQKRKEPVCFRVAGIMLQLF